MLAAALLLAWTPILSAHVNHATKQYSLSIRKSGLAVALDEFSKQTGLQIGAELKGQDQQDRLVGPVVGQLTAAAALTQLLDGSGLSFQWEDEYTMRIFPALIKPLSAQNVAEMLVTGTRISGGEGPAPMRVFGHQRIERYGVSTLAGLTRYFTQQPFSFGDVTQQSGAQFFQLRGLGFDTTLVLINGRRTAPSANSISLNAFDLNTIPITAVDRIEVMSDSASAIYGADAIGGVVNIILKRGVQEPEIFLHYGAAEGGATERRMAGAAGRSFGRLTAALIVDYFEHDPLIGQDRDRWRNQDFRRFGGQDYRVTDANPGNVYSLTGRALPGLPSSQAGIPDGSTGIGLTADDFIATAGGANLESSFRFRSLSAGRDRVTAFVPLDFRVTPDTLIFGELLYADSTAVTQSRLPSLTRAVVPAANPFNPFGEAVAVDYLFDGMEPIEHRTESQLVRLVSGARGSWNGQWDWEVAGLYSDEDVSLGRANDIDQARFRAAIESSDPQTALNLFRDGPAGSDDLLASLIGAPQVLGFSSVHTHVSAFVRGPLFHLPAGASEFVFGGEWRRESVAFFETQHVAEGRKVASLFSELKLPLLDKLSVSLALRGDHYAGGSSSLNPQYGVVWRPAQDWLLRASYGTSFRPPSLFELHMPRQELIDLVADPLRGGAVSNVQLRVGGNPDLEVVTARSLTSGFVFTPSEWPGMRFAGSYWRVVMDDRIIVPPFNNILNAEDGYFDRVSRADRTADDIAAGRPGALQSLDITRLNYGRLETSGVDLDVSYLVETRHGCFNPTLSATWVQDYSTDEFNAPVSVNRVGIADTRGTIPQWRVVGALAWKLGGFGSSATATYTPAYQDANLNGPIDRRLPSRVLMDLQGWLELGVVLGEHSPFRQTKLTVGMLNLFDEAPDFAEAGFSAGYDITQADMKQRFTYLRLSKSF